MAHPAARNTARWTTASAIAATGTPAAVQANSNDPTRPSSSPSTMRAPYTAPVTKAGAAYRNSTWDLVDAVKDKKVDLKQIKDEELPPEM